jgi:hypothetical protein
MILCVNQEMGPGAWQDMIDDHAAAWNWRKIACFGAFFAMQLQTAICMQAKHIALHADMFF